MATGFVTFAFAITICLFLPYSVVDAATVKSKDVIKTIKTKYGDVYDCVDFYKQPAFDHPLLKNKNHSFHPQMRPSYRPKWLQDEGFLNHKEISIDDIKLEGGGCPQGSVPVRRLSHEDKLLQNQLRTQYAQLGNSNFSSNDQSPRNTFFAIIQSKLDMSIVYNGIASNLSVFNPSVQPSQYSSGEIIIKSGTDAIIAGWTVSPALYKDNKTRFFIYTVSVESQCMNLGCGFVLIRSDVALDATISPVSEVRKSIYVLPIFIYQDRINGNWWLELGSIGTIGFWPRDMFHGLYKSATYVACGGEVSGPSDLGPPKMGSGYWPITDKPEWPYCSNTQIVDPDHNAVYFDQFAERFMTDDERHYSANFYRDRHLMMYGGPDTYQGDPEIP